MPTETVWTPQVGTVLHMMGVIMVGLSGLPVAVAKDNVRHINPLVCVAVIKILCPNPETAVLVLVCKHLENRCQHAWKQLP